MSQKAMSTVKTTGIKKANSISQSQRTERSAVAQSPMDQIRLLQQTIGNQAVQRLFKSGVIQAKLKICAPNDIYEQEADRVAERVMRMPENTAISGQHSAIRKKGETIQLKPG